MAARIPNRSLVAQALLIGALFVVLAPIGVLLHEIDEHGVLDASHCACLVCHSTSHTPVDVEAEHLDLSADQEVRLPVVPEVRVLCPLTLCLTVSGRSPPVV